MILANCSGVEYSHINLNTTTAATAAAAAVLQDI
jgi:hypothetical protein